MLDILFSKLNITLSAPITSNYIKAVLPTYMKIHRPSLIKMLEVPSYNWGLFSWRVEFKN